MKNVIAFVIMSIAFLPTVHAQLMASNVRGLQSGSNGDETSVSINLNMNVQTSATSSDERQAALEKAQHIMLRIFAGQCNLIQAELGVNCKVNQMNINAGFSQNGGRNGEGTYINAAVQGTMALTPTGAAGQPKP